MKSLKPIMLVLAGILIVGVMFAFKAEEPKVETITLIASPSDIVIYYPDNTLKEVKMKWKDPFLETNSIINGLNNEGWKIKSSHSYNTYSNGPINSKIIYLERTKQ